MIGPVYDCFHFKRKVVLLFGCLCRKIGNEFKNCVRVLLWLLLKCPLEVFTHVGLFKKKDNDKLKRVQRNEVIKCLENKVCQKR